MEKDNKENKEYTLYLYESHKKVYPREITGFWQNIRNKSLIVLLLIYFIIPWINWDDRQAILFHISERRFYIFDIVLWPQDLIVLTYILLTLAFMLFFVTSIAGRIWCGYSCPQTIWTELFIWIERFVEGSRNKQIKLDKLPLSNPERIYKKILKYFLWWALSLFTGLTFVGYFTPIREYVPGFFTLSASYVAIFWGLFYAGATFLNAGYLREQFCKTMCPYARFQGAMYDEDTLLIAYDDIRGEPRKKAKRGENKDGHCIDCNLCVQVCPVGIDIRDGNQFQCIGCAMCIDACNEVMEKLEAPKNLIRYTSHNKINGKKTKIIRPKTIIYGFVLSVGIFAIFNGLSNISSIGLNIKRDRTLLARRLPDNKIENIYTLNLLNKSLEDSDFKLSVSGIPDLLIKGNTNVKINAGEVEDMIIKIVADKGYLKEKIQNITFSAKNEATGEEIKVIEHFFSKN